MRTQIHVRCLVLLAGVACFGRAVGAERRVAEIDADLVRYSKDVKADREKLVATIREMLQHKFPTDRSPKIEIVNSAGVAWKYFGLSEEYKTDVAEYKRVRSRSLTLIAEYKLIELADLLVNDIAYDDAGVAPLRTGYELPCVQALLQLGKPVTPAILTRLKAFEDLKEYEKKFDEQGHEILDIDSRRWERDLCLKTLTRLNGVEGMWALFAGEVDGKLTKTRMYWSENMDRWK